MPDGLRLTRRARSALDAICDTFAPAATASPRPAACACRRRRLHGRLGLRRGAAFPTASGVDPMVTIEALAHMNARGNAAKLS